MSTHSKFTPGTPIYTLSRHQIEHPVGYKVHYQLNSFTSIQLCFYFSNLFSHQKPIFYDDSVPELFKFYLGGEFAGERNKRIYQTVAFPQSLNPHSFLHHLSRSQYEQLFPKSQQCESTSTSPAGGNDGNCGDLIAAAPQQQQSSSSTTTQQQPNHNLVIVKPLDHFHYRVTYSNFLRNELFSYYLSLFERTVPSLIDGYLPLQRQLLYTLLCVTIENQMGQYEAARLFHHHNHQHQTRNQNYSINRNFSTKHATINPISIPIHRLINELTTRTEMKLDIGMITTLVSRLAQTWSNNYPLIQLSHSSLSGTRSTQSKEITLSSSNPSSIDGIDVQLSPVALALYPVDDQMLYQYSLLSSSLTSSTTFSINTISPSLPPLQPIIPTILLHCVTPNVGSQGSYQSSFLRYKITDIITNVKLMLSGTEPTELTPFYNAFGGDIKPDPSSPLTRTGMGGTLATTTTTATATSSSQPPSTIHTLPSYITTGKCIITDYEKCIVCVTELPIGMTGAQFKAFLLKKANSYEISSFWEEIKPFGLSPPPQSNNPLQTSTNTSTTLGATNVVAGEPLIDGGDEVGVSKSNKQTQSGQSGQNIQETLTTSNHLYYIQFTPEIFNSLTQSSFSFAAFLNLTSVIESPIMLCFNTMTNLVNPSTATHPHSSFSNFDSFNTLSPLNQSSTTGSGNDTINNGYINVIGGGSINKVIPSTPRGPRHPPNASVHASPYKSPQTTLVSNYYASLSTSQTQSSQQSQGITNSSQLQLPQPPLTEFSSIRSLCKSWFQQRLNVYYQRREYLIAKYDFLVQYHVAIIDFISMIISGDFNLFQYPTPEDTMFALMSMPANTSGGVGGNGFGSSLGQQQQQSSLGQNGQQPQQQQQARKFPRLPLEHFYYFGYFDQGQLIETFIQNQYQKYRSYINQLTLFHTKQNKINKKLSKWSRKAMGWQLQQTARHDSMVNGNASVVMGEGRVVAIAPIAGGGDNGRNASSSPTNATKNNNKNQTSTNDISSLSHLSFPKSPTPTISTTTASTSSKPPTSSTTQRKSVLYSLDTDNHDQSDDDDYDGVTDQFLSNGFQPTNPNGGVYGAYRKSSIGPTTASSKQFVMRFTDEDLIKLTETYGLQSQQLQHEASGGGMDGFGAAGSLSSDVLGHGGSHGSGVGAGGNNNPFSINPSLQRRLSQHLVNDTNNGDIGGSNNNNNGQQSQQDGIGGGENGLIRGFEYLLVLPPYQINPSSLLHHTQLLDLYTKLLTKLQRTTVQELWLHDLGHLEEVIGVVTQESGVGTGGVDGGKQ